MNSLIQILLNFNKNSKFDCIQVNRGGSDFKINPFL